MGPARAPSESGPSWPCLWCMSCRRVLFPVEVLGDRVSSKDGVCKGRSLHAVGSWAQLSLFLAECPRTADGAFQQDGQGEAWPPSLSPVRVAKNTGTSEWGVTHSTRGLSHSAGGLYPLTPNPTSTPPPRIQQLCGESLVDYEKLEAFWSLSLQTRGLGHHSERPLLQLMPIEGNMYGHSGPF